MKNFQLIIDKIKSNDLIKRYGKAHILIFVCFTVLLNGTSKKSLELVRAAADNKILLKLRRRYNKFVREYQYDDKLERKKSDKIWILWLQGMENAPEVVKKCYQSIQDNYKHKEIVLLTESNYREYVTFPDYIQKKIDNNIITKTHMSDLLRLELLIKYGGTWIDSTVLCTGNEYEDVFFDSKFFFFQTLKPGLDGQAVRMSSWFITSFTNNPILLLTRDLLYEYWKKNNYMIDYFLMHDFFELALEKYYEEYNNVIPFSNEMPHMLLLRLFDKYNEDTWNAIKQQTSIHKLTYKFGQEETMQEDTYFKKVMY